jgi:hypothetical protein
MVIKVCFHIVIIILLENCEPIMTGRYKHYCKKTFLLKSVRKIKIKRAKKSRICSVKMIREIATRCEIWIMLLSSPGPFTRKNLVSNKMLIQKNKRNFGNWPFAQRKWNGRIIRRFFRPSAPIFNLLNF